MTDDPAFLTLTQVEALHRLALQRHGGQEGVRDPAGLESAVMHPLNVWLYGQGSKWRLLLEPPTQPSGKPPPSGVRTGIYLPMRQACLHASGTIRLVR